MSLNRTRLTLTRTAWFIYAGIEVALFVLANVTAKNASHPGTVSQIFFFAFLVGLAMAVVLGAKALIQRRGAR